MVFYFCFASLIYLNKARFVETQAKMPAPVFVSTQNLNRAAVEQANELATFFIAFVPHCVSNTHYWLYLDLTLLENVCWKETTPSGITSWDKSIVKDPIK